MHPDNEIYRSSYKKLKSYFEASSKGGGDVDKDAPEFVGAYGTHPGNRTVFQNALGYAVPADVMDFINVFGGTKLFVSRYGLGLEVYEMDSIAERNLNLQETTEEFFPKFALIAEDTGSGDFLCLYHDGRRCHFGILDHQAWAEIDFWANEAITFCHFHKWLEYFVFSGGEIIPPKNACYDIAG
jgi:hypothetical protein